MMCTHRLFSVGRTINKFSRDDSMGRVLVTVTVKRFHQSRDVSEFKVRILR